MSYILSINDKTKAPVNETGDIVAVYDFEPTATERDLFEITTVEKVKAQEIMEDIEKDIDPEKNYPKYKGNIDGLTTADKNVLKNKDKSISEIRAKIKKIRIKKPLVDVTP